MPRCLTDMRKSIIKRTKTEHHAIQKKMNGKEGKKDRNEEEEEEKEEELAQDAPEATIPFAPAAQD